MPLTERQRRVVFGWVAISAGALTAALVYRHPEQLEAPAWVVYAACSVFVLAGLTLLTSESEHPRLNAWLGVGVIAGLLVPGAWIALGAGPRKCSVSIPFWSGPGSDALCRGVFGFGSLMVAAFLVWAVMRAWRTTRGPAS